MYKITFTDFSVSIPSCFTGPCLDLAVTSSDLGHFFFWVFFLFLLFHSVLEIFESQHVVTSFEVCVTCVCVYVCVRVLHSEVLPKLVSSVRVRVLHSEVLPKLVYSVRVHVLYSEVLPKLMYSVHFMYY